MKPYLGTAIPKRTLLHKMLLLDDVLAETTLPVSAGLLHNVDRYMSSIDSYQAGDPLPIVGCVCDALEIALALGIRARTSLARIVENWRNVIVERAGSVIHDLPELLIEHPVINVLLVAETLGVSERAARDVVKRAEEYGMVRRIGTARRGVFYQADDILDLLDELAGEHAMRRTKQR